MNKDQMLYYEFIYEGLKWAGGVLSVKDLTDRSKFILPNMPRPIFDIYSSPVKVGICKLVRYYLSSATKDEIKENPSETTWYKLYQLFQRWFTPDKFGIETLYRDVYRIGNVIEFNIKAIKPEDYGIYFWFPPEEEYREARIEIINKALRLLENEFRTVISGG